MTAKIEVIFLKTIPILKLKSILSSTNSQRKNSKERNLSRLLSLQFDLHSNLLVARVACLLLRSLQKNKKSQNKKKSQWRKKNLLMKRVDLRLSLTSLKV